MSKKALVHDGAVSTSKLDDSSVDPTKLQGAPGAEDPSEAMSDAHAAAAHDDMQALVKAHSIHTDPHRLARVHALAGRHKAVLGALPKPKTAVTSVDDLKDIYSKKFGSKKPPSTGGQ